MLAEIYLLQWELAAHASEKPAPQHDHDFVPFSLEAFVLEQARLAVKQHDRRAS